MKKTKIETLKKVGGITLHVGAMLFVLAILLAACNPAPDNTMEGKVTPEEAKSIAREVFLWGMHPVGIYHWRHVYSQNAGINRIYWSRKPMKAFPRMATTPNATTLYGTAMLDLSEEPVVIVIPEITNLYWSVQMVDNYARWWHMIGSQFNAPGTVKRLLIGPDWSGSLPDGFVGADIVKSPSNFSGALVRIALTDDTEKELQLVNSIQDRITLMTLSQWEASGRKEVKAEDMPITPAKYPTYPGMDSISTPGRLKGMDFMRWVSLVLNDPSFTKQEDGYKEINALARFERIGLKAGTTFDPSLLAPEIKLAIEEGIEEGRKDAMALADKGTGVDRNGWDFSNDLRYKDTDWEQRAFYGLLALLAPIPSRSHTGSFCMKDSEGQPLSGEHKYTITFNLDDMPPVSEFWEMPLYDKEGYFYDNPLDRYSLNSFMLERGKLHTENGKLVIYVQHDKPSDPKQLQNWLPAPEDGFQFAARFYGAYTPIIDGSYNMPGVVRVD